MRTLLILAALAMMAVSGGGAFIYYGLYNPAATVQHTAPVFWLLTVAMRQSVQHHARDVRVPPLDEIGQIDAGGQLYRAHCVQCHGAPGVAPDAFALGMMPLPGNLALTAREWQDPAELYWVVRYGIKMSGMPAWEFRLTDPQLWAIVAFVNTLPGLSPRDYRSMTQAGTPTTAAIAGTPIAIARNGPDDQGDLGDQGDHGVAGDPARGRIALQQYACVACHVIPGVVGAVNPVGPSLAGMAARKYLAGMLPNTPQAMVRWLRSPQTVAPDSAMPDLGVSERDARDMAAFLETLK